MAVNTVLLDRDGVINEVVIREGKVSSPRKFSEFLFVKEIFNFVNKMNEASINLAIISNQPDIARGLLSADELELMNDLIRKELGIRNIFVCPHEDSDICSCRKPKFGLIKLAKEKMGFDKKRVIFVGDGWKDMEAGRRFGVQTVLLRTDYNASVQGDIMVKNLNDLVDIIIAKELLNKDS